MEPKDSCADRIKLAMDRLGIKPVDLVKKTGISKATISQYLSGKYNPGQERLEIIAKALNVPEAWLLGYDLATELPLNADEAEIISLYRSANPQIKDAVKSVLKSCVPGREVYEEIETKYERTRNPRNSGSA